MPQRHFGHIATVMFARQMGKNETSAQLEAYLLTLYARRGGSIVKAAPSFKPQIVNSILRLKEALDRSPTTRRRWHPSFGYMVRLGRAGVTFLSADSHANVVGATASLLLEIDEAQDVDSDKYDRDFRPMASSTNATTVLYGTAWAEDSILEQQRRRNLEHEQQTGERLHFEYDWTVLAALNPYYRSFVEGEIGRLGEEHPTIQTQYLLRCVSDAGRLFSLEQRGQLAGVHSRQLSPGADSMYVAGIDLAGEDEQAEDAIARRLSPRRDSTVISIGDVTRDGSGQPVVRVVEHLWWTGRDQVWQYERLLDLWERWNFARVCVDASGIGAGVAAFLADKHPDRTERFVFTTPSKSRLAYSMLAMTNTGRLSLYAADGSAEYKECRREIEQCRYWLRAAETMAWGVPETEGHDDFVTSLALLCRAAEELVPPPVSALIRARPDEESGW
jgi:Terminase RNaseH-like domain